jgi:hypothetical protein
VQEMAAFVSILWTLGLRSDMVTHAGIFFFIHGWYGSGV